MRRFGIMALVAAGIVALAVTLTHDDRADYRFVAIFDDAQGIVPGHQVKVAGAVAGRIDSVQLTAGPKARVEMTIDPRLGPLHADARCSILPQGLVSEYFVECDPGKASQVLGAQGALPTVGLSQTTVPVSLQDVLNVFAMPTNQRLTVLLTELGITTAGRGHDLNALLRRANPALQSTRKALATVNADRRALGAAISQTDSVIDELHQRDADVRRFVSGAAGTSRQLAAHQTELSDTVRRLPALLAAARPGLASLSAATARSTPVLKDLRSAAPRIEQLTHSLPTFAEVGRPALEGLASAAQTGTPALRAARPLVARLNRVAQPLSALAGQLDTTLRSTRDTGGLEGLLGVLYGFATSTALQDSTSHIFSITANVASGCIAADKLHKVPRGCDHSYRGEGQGTVPINAPSCGPKHPSWFTQRCDAVPGPLSRRSPVSTKRRPTSSGRRPGTPAAPATQNRPVCTSGTTPPKSCNTKPIPLADALDKLVGGITGDVDNTVSSLLDFLLG